LRAHHNYSLLPRIPAGDNDPLVKWMASRESGHCELFAGSFVLLARTAGFPSRMVTGFKGGSWNAYSNNFTIRNSDAHAWAEIFDVTAGAGSWLRTDPLELPNSGAAESKGEASLARRLDRSWTARFDSLRVFWYRRIVSFDQRSQAETLKTLKAATQDSGRRLKEFFQEKFAALKEWATSPWNGRRLINAGLVFAGLAGAVWLLREFGAGWWRGLSRGRGPRHDDPARREAGRWLVRLRARSDGMTAESDELRRVDADLQRIRFGARETWPEPEPVFRRARRALRERRREAKTVRR
jgi:hypothetical protein